MLDSNIQSFNQLLQENKQSIIKAWFNVIVNSYPEKTAKFLTRQKDQFANPVGAIVSKEMENIFDELLQEKSSEHLVEYIDAIVRVRAVQDFKPSGAVGFFWKLKHVVREKIGSKVEEYRLQEELNHFEDKIELLCLEAFDVFMNCREKIWELKAKEAQDRTRNLLRIRSNVDWKKSKEKDEKPINQP